MVMLPSEDGYEAWLRYGKVDSGELRREYGALCASIHVALSDPWARSLREELSLGLSRMLGAEPMFVDDAASATFRVVLSESAGVAAAKASSLAGTTREGFGFSYEDGRLLLAADSPASAIHGGFSLLLSMARGLSVRELPERETPGNGLRMIDHWDNMDGSVERGYAGRSIFFRDGGFREDDERLRDYARLLASVGINAVSINNVNVHETESFLITPRFLPEVARIAEIFRAWGIRLFLSVNYAAPITVGGLPVSDPLDPEVRKFWVERAIDIYQAIPDFGGFVVKADSEGRPGPFAYGRDHCDGANMLARALAPYGGLVAWRCFVYNCAQDWRDRSMDRAKAAYEHFQPLDGRFDDNVVLQIKNGPVDFQVREPVSTLFGGMKATNQVLELQITQEYTGQQRHLCFLAPQWKSYLDFATYAGNSGAHPRSDGAPLKAIASGEAFGRNLGGMAGVSNIGDDRNWCGHHLAQANFFAFGRLSWDPDLPSMTIADEWIRLTFGSDPEVRAVISSILDRSWPAYEGYTAPLGVGWMVRPNHHYGPDPDGYEYDRWGTYHFADRDGLGVDRSVATGTGYAGQYLGLNRALYESIATCPDELLLFFHHVPYDHVLHSGKTVIQHIYDSHFEGAREARTFRDMWKRLEGRVDAERFTAILSRLEEQARHAEEWRDIINTYFFRKSGMADARGRRIY